MRLHTFILENMELILQEWENFAREIWPSNSPCIVDLRDHAQEMLLAMITDMQTRQSEAERREKSIGHGRPSKSSDTVDLSSARHALSRWDSGFDLRTLVAEYRSLRASVLHLWSEANPDMTATQIADMTRFNECVDQLLAESVKCYAEYVEHSRELFLGILGHDLRTPLCAMSTAVYLLDQDAGLSSPTRRLASMLAISVREMESMVVDLLDFTGARLGATMQITRQPMNLDHLFRELIEEAQMEHPCCRFELETHGDGEGEWDRQRLRKLILNLLSNAVKHGAEQTPIRLFIKADGNEVVFGTCNQGPPIPPAMQTEIFNPLHRRSGGGSSSDSRSLGLGLYIARQVANAHGGDIEVLSNDMETIFAVRLPRIFEARSQADGSDESHCLTAALRTI